MAGAQLAHLTVQVPVRDDGTLGEVVFGGDALPAPIAARLARCAAELGSTYPGEAATVRLAGRWLVGPE